MPSHTTTEIISATKDTNKPNSSNLGNLNLTKKLTIKFLRLQNRVFTGIGLNAQRQKTLERLFICCDGLTEFEIFKTVLALYFFSKKRIERDQKRKPKNSKYPEKYYTDLNNYLRSLKSFQEKSGITVIQWTPGKQISESSSTPCKFELIIYKILVPAWFEILELSKSKEPSNKLIDETAD